MRTWLTVVALLLTVSAVSAMDNITALSEVPVSTLDNGALYITDKIVVTMQEGTKPLEMNNMAAGYASTGHENMDMLCQKYKVIKVEPWYAYKVRNEHLRSLVERMYIFTVESGLDAADVKDSFLSCSDVEYSDLYKLPLSSYIPNDPSVSSQWALSAVSAFSAWDLIRGDTTASVVISINDTGVYWTHADLSANMWINGPEDLNDNGVFDNYPESSGGDLNEYDDDGNGFADDVVGFDLGQGDANPQEITPTHGTHVAGCASEVADNGTGGAGTGFWARIHACKITNSAGQLTQGYQGMIYGADTGVDIINLSWGSPGYSSGEQNIINYVYDIGVTVVAAAGNDDNWPIPFTNYPSAYNHVLAVASTDSDDRKSSFSNYGTWVDISAPGSNIYATWAQNSYTSLSGTSMSSPIAAGAAALVKAQNPDATPDQVMNSLIGSTDDIDDLNPSYIGLIGTGRLNMHSALGALNYPNIEILAHQVTIINDDGDDILNPGESVELAVVMQNIWQDATNTVLTLRAPDGITVTDSITNLGTFPGDGEQMDNSADPFALMINDNAAPGDYDLVMQIVADGPYDISREIVLRVSLVMENFPVTLSGAVESSPMICDFDGDGLNEIVVGCNDSRLYAIEANGDICSGFPFEASDDIKNGAAVADIDHDGDSEIVFAAEDGMLYAIDHTGNILSGFPIDTDGSLFGSPSLADLDADGDLEIIIANLQSKEINIYDHDGTTFGEWPYTSDQGWYGGVALGDIDGDDALEIVIAGFDMKLHVFNSDKTEVTGFPVDLDNRVWGTPVIGNLDPSDTELEIVTAAYSGSVYLINHDGSVAANFPIDLDQTIKTSPSLGDFDGDSHPEIAIGTNSGDLYLIDSDGTIFTGYPVELESGISSSPVVADIDNDGSADVIIGNGSSTPAIYAFDSAGQAITNFPVPTQEVGQINGSPAIWDIDADGDLDIVVGVTSSVGNLEVIDYKTNAHNVNVEWSAFANDRVRSGNYDALGPVSIDDDPVVLPQSFSLNQNYPNPFNANTVISYNLDSRANVSLDIYDVLGRQVTILESGYRDAGLHSVIWNGKNAEGSLVASGIYFYKLDTGEKTSVKRMIYLR